MRPNGDRAASDDAEVRVLGAYLAAVGAATLVFLAGAAIEAMRVPQPAAEAPPSGAIEVMFAFLTTFFIALVFALPPFLIGLAAFRAGGIGHPAWFVAYGAATGLLLGWGARSLGVGLVVPAIAGAAGGATYRLLHGGPRPHASR